MSWILLTWNEFLDWLPALLAILNLVVTVGTISWVLMTKSNSTSAVAWCLIIIFLPFLGAMLFFFFGYQHVDRPLRRKRLHKQRYKKGGSRETPSGRWLLENKEGPVAELVHLASRFGAQPPTTGNRIDFYHDGPPAIAAMLQAIENARHHIHIEVFIFQPDALGKQFIEVLAAQARRGIEVRLLYDAMGSYRLPARILRPLHAAGGQSDVFLPLNLFRRRLQINMRNHRKICVVDGTVGFIGGLNIGEEYVCKSQRFGYWRDTHLRIVGPAVADLQHVFGEDWDFATGENLALSPRADVYFQERDGNGPYPIQVIDSGPDRDLKGIREIYFAAILKAKRRLWIASPYFVPDDALLQALRLAAYLGVDVRLLGQWQADKWIPQYAAQYYWDQVLACGVKVYQYTRGMMHSKVVLVDDDWATVGTANLDNRSLHLNFEINCILYSKQAVAELEQAFLRDLEDSIRLDAKVFQQRPFAVRLLENACRLLSPVL